MTVEGADIPPEQRGGRESLGRVTRTNRPIYFLVVLILGVVLLVGVIGWLWLAADGVALPEGLGVILGTVAGGLVGLISAREDK
jgi:hypothetical protein